MSSAVASRAFAKSDPIGLHDLTIRLSHNGMVARCPRCDLGTHAAGRGWSILGGGLVSKSTFDALVATVERLAAESPSTYRSRLNRLVLLGYGYIVGIIVALTVLAVACLGLGIWTFGGAPWYVSAGVQMLSVSLVITTTALMGYVLRGLFTPDAAPGGIEVTRSMAPALFDA